MQHRQHGQILQRVVQHLQQVDQVGNFKALVKAAPLHVQRYVKARKLPGIPLRFVCWRPEQDRHITPIDRPKAPGGFIPDGMLLHFQIVQPQCHQSGFLIRFFELEDVRQFLRCVLVS